MSVADYNDSTTISCHDKAAELTLKTYEDTRQATFAGSLSRALVCHAQLAQDSITNGILLCRVHELPAEDVLKTPNGDHFVKAHKQKGILPEILEELLSARKRAKTDLKAATNPFMKAVLDGASWRSRWAGRCPACCVMGLTEAIACGKALGFRVLIIALLEENAISATSLVQQCQYLGHWCEDTSQY